MRYQICHVSRDVTNPNGGFGGVVNMDEEEIAAHIDAAELGGMPDDLDTQPREFWARLIQTDPDRPLEAELKDFTVVTFRDLQDSEEGQRLVDWTDPASEKEWVDGAANAEIARIMREAGLGFGPFGF